MKTILPSTGKTARPLAQFRCDVAQTSCDCLACETKRPLGIPAVLAESDQFGSSVDGFGQILQQVVDIQRAAVTDHP